MPHIQWTRNVLSLAITLLLLCAVSLSQAQQYGKPPKKKKEVTLLRKGWDDLTTRNNYYFNAKTIYNEMVKNYLNTRQLNYNDTLPFYFHDSPDFKPSEQAIKNIIIKTGITLQRHDYSRWKDDCYHLLGRAHYLKGNTDTALISFQYVTTTLRGKFNNKKVAVSQKEILKAKQAKYKEQERLANSKKKEMEQKQKEKEAAIAKAISDKQKRMDAAAKQKEKDLKKRIREKEKMIRQKAKGKYKPPTTKTVSKPTAPTNQKSDKKSSGKKPSDILDKVSQGISIDLGPQGSQAKVKSAEKKVASLEAAKRKSEIGNVEDSIAQKKLDKANELTFWEKIKHHPIRPESIVWLTKSYMQKGDYSSAESMLAYSKTLRKLSKKDKKELKIVESFFYYKSGYHAKAGEIMNEAIPFIKKKKDKSYYSYLQAQLIESSDVQTAYKRYQSVRKFNKDEQIDFYALEQMRRLIRSGKVVEPDMEAIEKEYKKASKSKLFGDKALFALADLALMKNDTAKSIAMLKKSIASIYGTKDQKSISMIRLSELLYDSGKYTEALEVLDSALAILPKDFKDETTLRNRQQHLNKVVKQISIIHQQDSLLALSKMSREELADYIREQNKIQQKQKRKAARQSGEDASFSTAGLGNISNFNISQDQYTLKGQWYFYNNDLKTRGFNEFRQQWGDRPLTNNWRRIEASRLSGVNRNANAGDGTEENTQKTEPGAETVKATLAIPYSDEEKEKALSVIEAAMLQKGITFYEGLKDFSPALASLNEQLERFPKGKLAVEAHYYKMLIYNESGRENLAKKEMDYITTHFPDSEYAKKIVKASGQIAYIRKGGPSDAEKVYASLYTQFNEGQYQEVIMGRKSFIERFGTETKLLPKVNFLEALSLAKTGELEAYKESLNELIKNHPNTPEGAQARLFLNSLLQNKNEQTDSVGDEKKEEIKKKEVFQYQDGFHYIIYIMKDKNPPPGSITQVMNDLMESQFPGERIKATISYLDAKTPLILVKRFNKIDDALKGLAVLKSAGIKGLENSGQYDIMLISQDNFKELFISKDIQAYKEFHQQYYNLN
jgi:hypothetical protein